MPFDSTLREATRSDLPRGRESQCVLCWRIFGSDSTCEAHKSYRKPKSDACKAPVSVGLEQRDRRGFAVWVRAMPLEVIWARSARNDLG